MSSLTGNSWILLSASSPSLVRQAGFDGNIWRKSSVMQLCGWEGEGFDSSCGQLGIRLCDTTPRSAGGASSMQTECGKDRHSKLPHSAALTSLVLPCALPDVLTPCTGHLENSSEWCSSSRCWYISLLLLNIAFTSITTRLTGRVWGSG